jgi:hypothetical protein
MVRVVPIVFLPSIWVFFEGILDVGDESAVDGMEVSEVSFINFVATCCCCLVSSLCEFNVCTSSKRLDVIVTD